MAPNQSDQPSNTTPGPTEQGSLVPLGDNSASQNIVESARGRSDGFDVGDDRAIADPPNWSAQNSNQLWHAACDNNEPGTAEATGHVWAHHGTELKQASDHLYNAIAELGNAWVGKGAAGAQGALVAIANSGSQASEAAHTMSDRLHRQSTAAAAVKQMPQPVVFDPKMTMELALAGGPAALTDDQKVQFDAANDVKAQQVAMFNAYTQTMSEIDSSTPSFGPESLGMKPTASHNSLSFNAVNSVGSTGSVDALPGAGEAIFASGGAGFGGHSGAFGAQHAGVVGPNGAHGGVPAAGFGADAATLGSDGAGGTAAGMGGTTTGAGHVAPAGGQSGAGNPLGKIGMGLGLGGAAGGLGALASRALGAGSKSGAKKSENETTLASADGQGQSAASAQAPQQGVVSSAGTIGGQTPPPMNPGMGGMAPQGAQGERDDEHTHASFLIEADPDEAFGANQATPPPVIGAWSEDDEDR
ncbi:hypothetical protein [Amycolatopsis sp. NPDC051716]|uniref:hypothetical protein n=1 Tax=Amycolatopsis sp. NPDC051716 TaxID=3155804 RepID=UPI00341736FF